jgi:phosphoribosyl-dephospho-CoA transferase
MKNLTRNQLVWLDQGAWAQIEDRLWDAEAQTILAHWRTQRLPLVVCRQRTETPADQVCLGLPAPQQWSRRRLALTVNLSAITDCGVFPSLLQVARTNHWAQTALNLSDALLAQGVQAQVYGSHGWQLLTGLPYVHATSDLDLSLRVSNFEAASQVAQLLEVAPLPMRMDGEIVFCGGQAIAWRELHKLLAGQTAQVIVKDLHRVWLASREEVCTFGRCAQSLDPGMAVALS